MSAFSLAGRRALVTGANTGIGQAIALALADQGASVTCAGRRDCAETCAAIAAKGGIADEMILDFADPMAAREILRARAIPSWSITRASSAARTVSIIRRQIGTR